MPVPSESFCTSSLTEILRKLVKTKQTGYLKIKEGEQEGCVVIENGIIISARTASCVSLQALFQFVGWQSARFDFHERPLPNDLSRYLAVYDAQVLIEGVAFKEKELA